MITNIIEGGHKWFGVACDHCKEDWIDEERGVQFMPDELSILNETVGNEWIRGGYGQGKRGEHYCDKCGEWDDNDIFILKPERKDLNME